MALLLVPLGPAEPWRKALEAELPGLELRVWPELGDPAAIDVAVVGHPPRGMLATLPNLRLVISLLAGAESVLGDPTVPRHVTIARSSEPDGDQMMNEAALMHVLRHHRYLHEYLLLQQRHEWKPQARVRARERKVGVMGLGAIGLPAAMTLRDHGFDVAGWTRRPRTVEGIAVFHGRDQLGAFLGRSEIVVCLLAVTPATADILNRETFALMPKGAAVINLSRGQHVVDADLIAALDQGQLAAATLDVFRQEPLPADSPLWAHPRITIMPHVARRIEAPTVARRIGENVRRLHQGQDLLYRIDRDAGY